LITVKGKGGKTEKKPNSKEREREGKSKRNFGVYGQKPGGTQRRTRKNIAYSKKMKTKLRQTVSGKEGK